MPIVYKGSEPNETAGGMNLRHDLQRTEGQQTTVITSDIANKPDDSPASIEEARAAFEAWLVANDIDPS